MRRQLFLCVVAALFCIASSIQRSDWSPSFYRPPRRAENAFEQRYLADLKKYDRNVMPQGNGGNGSSVEVRCEMYLLDISEVDDLNMDYRAMFYFRQSWNDSRLAYTGKPILSITLADPSYIWTPDLFFVQEKEGIHHKLTSSNIFIKISPTGEVRYSMRLSMTFKCPMNFKKYPHDKQQCNFQIESYGQTRDQLSLSWDQKTPNPVAFDKNISTVNFALKGVKESVNHVTFSFGEFTSLQVSLAFQRKTGFFMIRLYAPFLLLVGVSWLCFWVPAKLLALRFPLLLVILYLMFNIGSEVNGRSPPVSYTKGSDVWIGVCESLVFASFLETIFVYIFYKKREQSMRQSDPEALSVLEMDEKMNQMKNDSSINLVASRLKCNGALHKRIDKGSAFLFPSLFLIFNVVYGWIYCVGS